jgi:hypothetical protein
VTIGRRVVRSGLAAATLYGLFASSPAANAGEADVVSARVVCHAAGEPADQRVCRFIVAVKHADEGWEHYADRWEVITPEGRVLAVRVLRHPHVGEQPFTRALDGVIVPPGIERVRVRARDLVHGYGGVEREVELGPSGPPSPPADHPDAPPDSSSSGSTPRIDASAPRMRLVWDPRQ